MQAAQSSVNVATQHNRITHLQKIIDDQKLQIYQRIKKIHDDLIASKKYKQFKEQLRDRIQKTDKFIRHMSETFFTMLSDCQFLSLTTQIQLIEKIQKFKKNLFNSMQKITLNLDGRNIKHRKGLSHYIQMQEQQQIDENDSENKNTKQKRGKKSKNAKMSNQTSMRMMQWLLRNFQNPYPTTQQKQRMSQESNINVTQVNNWFINARERTIKSYFIKDL